MNGRSGYAVPLFLAVTAALAGVIIARTIPSAVFPAVAFPRAIVLAENQNLPSQQMLIAVTKPLEETAYGVPGVSRVRSTTTRGSSEIDVTFSAGTDPQVGFRALNAMLADARERLPAGTTVRARLFTTGSFPVIDLSLSSKTRSLPELTDVATYDLIPAFHRIPGVFRAEPVGAKYREYVVRLDPVALLARNLTARDVVNGLAAANVLAAPGRLSDHHRMLLGVVSGGLHDASALARVAIANQGGAPIRVGDVGQVLQGIKEDYIRTASEDGPAVLIGISRQTDGNIGAIAAAVRAAVASARQRYPDISFSLSYDQSALVAESFASVRDAIVLGLVLAFAVVLVFTGSLLSGLIALVIVTGCVAVTVLVLGMVGLTFDMMTLGGLAAGIGLFIDDAIVMIEGIHTERAQGAPAGLAVARAAERLTRPLIAATATAIVVFLPLALLTGITGAFFRSLATTLGSGLAISLLLALYVTPALEITTASFRHPARRRPLVERASAAVATIVAGFVKRPWLAAAGVVLILAAGLVLYRSLGTDYIPAMDEGAFILDYAMPPESTVADMQTMLGRIDQILRTTPEVAAFSRRTGAQLGFFLTETNIGDFSVRLHARRQRKITAVIDSVRARIAAEVPGVRVEFSQVLQDYLGDLAGTAEPIEVKVFGPDQDQLEGTARAIAAALHGIPGLTDIFDGIVLSGPEERFSVNQEIAGRYNLSATDLNTLLETIIAGTVATSVRAGDRLVDVRVRYPDQFHQSLASLGQVMLPVNGGEVPLSALLEEHYAGEAPELEREGLSPVIRVTARLDNRNLGDAARAVQQRIAPIPLPAGVHLELGGLYAQQRAAFRGLVAVMIAGLFGVFAVLLWEFGTLGAALAVLLGASACLTGGLAGLALTGLTLNISSMMGLIMVVGIAAKNGILLLDYVEHDEAAGVALGDAVARAVRQRTRPILMTALAAAAGMLPLALGLGAGAAIQQPLAVVVIGGLMLSLVISAPLTAGLYALWVKLVGSLETAPRA